MDDNRFVWYDTGDIGILTGWSGGFWNVFGLQRCLLL